MEEHPPEPRRVLLDDVAQAIAEAVHAAAGRPSYAVALPWPPSVNHYWRNARRKGRNGGWYNGRIVTDEGKAYRADVQAICLRDPAGRKGAGRASVVCMAAQPPDAGTHDLDNLFKAPLDALTGAGVFADDSEIGLLLIYRAAIVRGGRLGVSIWRMD